MQQVLNPKRCHPAMQKYDLGFIQNRHLFVRKPETGDGHYPIHMELNEVAKYELHQYCEAFMEELEDELTALVVANASDLIYKACFVEFKQCSKAKPKSEKAKAKAKRAAEKEKEIAKAREVFDAIDTDKNGLLTRAESAEHVICTISCPSRTPSPCMCVSEPVSRSASIGATNRYLHGSAHLVMQLETSTSARARATCMSSAKALSLTARAHLQS